MSRERALWAWLAKARFVYKSRLHMNRIENPAGPGMPDVEGYLAREITRSGSRQQYAHVENGGQFWIELKSAERPKRPETPVRFKVRPRQIAWGLRRWAVGRCSWWLLQVGSGAERKIYLLPGDKGRDIARGMPEIDLGLWAVNDEYDGRKLKPEDIVRIVTQ